MYIVRPLSEYKKNPDALSRPPDGPNSGYMVIQDKDSESYSCCGMFKNRTLKHLPFPQNKIITVHYELSIGGGGSDVSTTYFSLNDVIFIPVLNLPLSSNRYYAIKPHGNHKGKAFTCSRDEDMRSCCFCSCVKDIKQQPFDVTNIYQQMEINVHKSLFDGKGLFYAKSVASDGHPPDFMRRKGWSVDIKTPKRYKLEETYGLDASLRAHRLDKISEAVVVGKWYTPFMFVKEGKVRDQMKRSTFYMVTLEKKWEMIFSSKDNHQGGKSVKVDVDVDLEIVYVGGKKAVWDEKNVVENAVWFKSSGKKGKVGLAVELVQRMKWEEGRGGWEGAGRGRQVKVKRSEKFEGNGVWKDFGCYVLVESFVFKRMDASVVLTYDFRHTQHIKSTWS